MILPAWCNFTFSSATHTSFSNSREPRPLQFEGVDLYRELFLRNIWWYPCFNLCSTLPFLWTKTREKIHESESRHFHLPGNAFPHYRNIVHHLHLKDVCEYIYWKNGKHFLCQCGYNFRREHHNMYTLHNIDTFLTKVNRSFRPTTARAWLCSVWAGTPKPSGPSRPDWRRILSRGSCWPGWWRRRWNRLSEVRMLCSTCLIHTVYFYTLNMIKHYTVLQFMERILTRDTILKNMHGNLWHSTNILARKQNQAWFETIWPWKTNEGDDPMRRN